jgi:hypothetical protein
MENSIAQLRRGFMSSSVKTPQFKTFARTFKCEFKKELDKINAKIEHYNVGHFYVSGFFRKYDKLYYFSLSDVRGLDPDSNSCMSQLLYRTAKHLKDYTGGINQYVSLHDVPKMDLI